MRSEERLAKVERKLAKVKREMEELQAELQAEREPHRFMVYLFGSDGKISNVLGTPALWGWFLALIALALALKYIVFPLLMNLAEDVVR